MRRILLVGVPGSGKTTVGRMLAGTLDAPFVELDGIFHQPGWAELAKDDFRDRVRRVVAADAWVSTATIRRCGISSCSERMRSSGSTCRAHSSCDA